MYLNEAETIKRVDEARLTLTWDVFKWRNSCNNKYYRKWLTLTWDVFK